MTITEKQGRIRDPKTRKRLALHVVEDLACQFELKEKTPIYRIYPNIKWAIGNYV